jgi:hypothetical protein
VCSIHLSAILKVPLIPAAVFCARVGFELGGVSGTRSPSFRGFLVFLFIGAALLGGLAVSLLVEAATGHGSFAGNILITGLGLMLLAVSAVVLIFGTILGLYIGDRHTLVQKTPTTRCDTPCSNRGGIGILGVTTERQRYTYRIGAALASAVSAGRRIDPDTARFLME